MDLKDYQKRVVEEVERYLRAVAEEHAKGNRRFAAKAAWEDLKIPGGYTDRRNGLGEDLPSFYIKVPTGGGKTLLATQILGLIHRTILRDRNGAGLVLWIVPSSQIYRDTLKRLRDRTDMYRIMLEHALSRRIEVWEKDEITRLTPGRLRDCLNILVLQLASTNRETKEQLKFFRDSGGNIVQHFPAEEDAQANRMLKQSVPNLEMIQDEDGNDLDLVKTSVGNLVRLGRPAVILDEGHRATSKLAQQTIEGFNASIVVELSATPPEGANILCKVSGQALLDEHMIKLPLNVVTKVLFYLQCADCRFEMPESIRIESTTAGKIELLAHDDGGRIAQSLFEDVDGGSMDTEYERQVALVLDRDVNVLWWYRNRVGPGNFMIQGYKRARIYPDFVVQGKHGGQPMHRVLVVESKGAHLEGNLDTTYKRKVSSYFNRAGKRVTWQQLGEGFKDHLFRFQVLDEAQPHGCDWQDELRDVLAANG
jgi:hypothetical protein